MINDKKTYGKLKVHSGNKIIDHKTPVEWKIQLTMLINFMFSKDFEETCTVYTKSHNVEIMISNGTDDIIKWLFASLLQKASEKLTKKW